MSEEDDTPQVRDVDAVIHDIAEEMSRHDVRIASLLEELGVSHREALGRELDAGHAWAMSEVAQKLGLQTSPEPRPSEPSPPKESPYGMSVKDRRLGFAPRTRGALANAQLHTLGDLTRVTEGDLREQAGLRDASINKIREVLGSHGLFLRGDDAGEEQ